MYENNKETNIVQQVETNNDIYHKKSPISEALNNTRNILIILGCKFINLKYLYMNEHHKLIFNI